MAKAVTSSKESAELQRLYDEHAKASKRAAEILAAKGMESHEFLEADKTTGIIYRRIREILGTSGSQWMT
jgi:hypothetical protein